MQLMKTRRVQLLPTENFTETYKYVRDLMEKCTGLSNEIIRRHFFTLYEMDEIKQKTPGITSKQVLEMIKVKYGYSVQNIGYDVSKKYDDIPSATRTCINQNIYKNIKKKIYGILNNRESLPSFRKDVMPIPFQPNKDFIKVDEKDYIVSIYKQKFKINFGRDRSDNKSIVNRIISGEYKIQTSNIIIKDKKIFLNLTYIFESDNSVEVDYKKILGVDLGINRPVALSRNYAEYTPQIDIGGKIQTTRMGIQKRRTSLQRALKHSQGGRGRKAKMCKMDDMRSYEHNFMKSMNDLLSKRIIDYCLSEGIGTIHIEDLKGITMDVKNYFLKSWSYYQLQEMIKYKAAEHDIKVLYVNPKYTSQTCACCGNTDKEQRKSTKFVCANDKCDVFGIEVDADINAAKNIANREGYEERKKSSEKKLEMLEMSE